MGRFYQMETMEVIYGIKYTKISLPLLIQQVAGDFYNLC